jgi:hypothetical protein
MQAKLCDVCGQICKPLLKGKECSLSIIDWDDDSPYMDANEHKIDLCESCQNKLKLWVQSNGSVKL